jgi:heat shock protein HslJ
LTRNNAWARIISMKAALRISIGFVCLSVSAIVVGCQSEGSRPSASRSSAARSDGDENPAMVQDLDWRLVNLRGSPVEKSPAGTRAPMLRLDSEQKHISGYTGVSDFEGSYQLSGSTLHFSPLAMTKRASLPPLMRLEDSFVDALHETSAWRRVGEDIELLDVAGQPLARLTRAEP